MSGLSRKRMYRMNLPFTPTDAQRQASTRAFAAIAEAVDARMLALVRCMLAFSAFAVVYIDTAAPHQWSTPALASLGLYSFYSIVLAVFSRRSGWRQPHRMEHWTDVAFYVYLAAITGGGASIFFNFFLFAILVASFTRGTREGMLVSAVSLLAFIAIALKTTLPGSEFEFDRASIRAVYLFVFGSMISYWGGYESLLKRRLALLNDINNAWNPRLGAGRIIGNNLHRLLDFYDATSCVLVARQPSASSEYVMYRSLRTSPEAPLQPIAMTTGASGPLLALPDSLGACYHAPDGPWQLRWRGYAARDTTTGKPVREYRQDCAALANLLDTSHFISVPYGQYDNVGGRLYLAGARHGFALSDIDFLAQAASAMATIAANAMLIEELIGRASEQERRKISRDLHDSTIQPYIGLKLALDALLRDAPSDNPLTPRLDELAEMAGMTIRDLREYAASFRDSAAVTGSFLLASIGRKIESLRRFYGIDVELDAALAREPGDRLAAASLHIASEGLSNILRHTGARRAFVRLRDDAQHLHIEVGNEAQQAAGEFMPLSIRDRVQALGGNIMVEHTADGYTVVRVAIPLRENNSRS